MGVEGGAALLVGFGGEAMACGSGVDRSGSSGLGFRVADGPGGAHRGPVFADEIAFDDLLGAESTPATLAFVPGGGG